MRYIGLDYGDHSVGIALSDPTGLIASPLETVKRADEAALKQTVRRIRELTEEYDVHTLILGYPKNMNNTEGIRVEKTLAFKKRLERDLYQVEILLWDERLSTKEAEIPLLMSGMDRFERKKIVDAMAASLILQGYLDSLRVSDSKEETVEENTSIIIYDPEEQTRSQMEVIDQIEWNGNEYFMAEFVEEEDLPEVDDEDEEDGVYIFRICEEKEHEFMILNEDDSIDCYVTTDLDDEESDAVLEAFSENGDYEFQI